MAFQRLESLAVLETDQVVGGHRLFDGDRRFGRLQRRLDSSSRDPQQGSMNLADQGWNFGSRRRIIAEIGRRDARGQVDEILAGSVVHGLILSKIVTT